MSCFSGLAIDISLIKMPFLTKDILSPCQIFIGIADSKLRNRKPVERQSSFAKPFLQKGGDL
jgi:hypothetical protein